MGKAVVITGVGVVSPYGIGLDSLIEGLRKKKPAFSPISLCDVTDSPVGHGGECSRLDEVELPQRKLRKMLNRKDLLAVSAATLAYQDADLAIGSYVGDAAGIFVGAASTQVGDFLPYFDHALDCVSADRTEFDSGKFGRECLDRVNPLAAVKVLLNGAVSHVSQLFGLKGAHSNLMNFETSGVDALIHGVRSILSGPNDLCMVGAMSAPIDPFQLAEGYHRGVASSSETLALHSTSGAFLSEAGVFLVLESWEHAASRKAKVLGRVIDGAEGKPLWGSSQKGRSLPVVVRCASRVPGVTSLEEELLAEESFRGAEKLAIFDCLGVCGEASGLLQAAVGLSLLEQQGSCLMERECGPCEEVLIPSFNRFGRGAWARLGRGGPG